LGIFETPQTDGISLDQTKERTVYAEAIIPQEDFYLAPVHGLKDSAYSFYYSSTKEIYDLKKDPLETHNLADSQPKRLKAYEIKMELLLDQAHLDHARVSLDQDSIELLRSLGYVAEGGAGLAEEDPFAFRSPLQSVKMYRELQRLRSFEETYPFKFREGLRNLIQQDPRQIVLYRDLGRTAAFAGDEKEALDNLRKAALLKPNDPRLHTFLGLGLYRFARFQEAIQEFDVALKLNPHHQSALYNKALTYAALGEIDTALQTFEQVLEVDPNDALTLNNLAFLSLSEKGEWQQAKAFIVRAFEINPKHPLILANKVWIETYPQP
ncbi:MAG: tetratricopeptide repeat protein, partial [Acidobacteria bacterium]|nr:tetratricopeptide repeat protein [Acidobacteriota bacterium]